MKYIKELAVFTMLSVVVAGAGDALAAGKTKKAKHAPAETSSTEASVPYAGEKPLMVVRFNQPDIAYQWPLYNTLSKALEVRPDAQFEVVSAAPRAADPAQQAKENDIASGDLDKVLATLKEIGMPENRFTVSKIYDNVQTSEVRFYVR